MGVRVLLLCLLLILRLPLELPPPLPRPLRSASRYHSPWLLFRQQYIQNKSREQKNKEHGRVTEHGVKGEVRTSKHTAEEEEGERVKRVLHGRRGPASQAATQEANRCTWHTRLGTTTNSARMHCTRIYNSTCDKNTKQANDPDMEAYFSLISQVCVLRTSTLEEKPAQHNIRQRRRPTNRHNTTTTHILPV